MNREEVIHVEKDFMLVLDDVDARHHGGRLRNEG